MKSPGKIIFILLILFGFSKGETISSPLASGTISGYVFNYFGLAISGATIGINNGLFTISGADGYYILEGVDEGEQTVACGKAGYNISLATILVISTDTIFYDFTLTQPEMFINPLLIEETLNPGEYITTYLNILNTGTGILGWEAEIQYLTNRDLKQEDEWLALEAYEGEIPPFGGVTNLNTWLNAAGTSGGELYEANIIFSSTPDIGQITIPVTMIIQGDPLIPPDNLTAELVDNIYGKVELEWAWEGDSFQFFLVKRDGSIIATTTDFQYTDHLNDHGYYCYTVQAVYNEGSTSPEGPACVEWPDPVLGLDPDSLEGWVWPGFTVDVFSTLTNQGEGTLTYSFPEFVALKLIADSAALGAGGPDPFGYIWIDSDEQGGPDFSFTDISTTGTPVYGISDDNIVGPYPIGFDFYFYGEEKSQFWVNSNGCIGFSSTYITLGNTSIPTNSSVYKDFIAWMWDDLVFRTGISQVFYQVIGNKLVIQFKNVGHIEQENAYINAEVVLFKNGKILLLYDDFDTGIVLDTCSVGLQSSNPGVGLQVVYNADYLHDHLAVLFSVPADFIIDVQPLYGTIAENSAEVITITYDSEQYAPGPHSQDLLLVSNATGNEQVLIDNTMYVYLPGVYSGIVKDNDDEEPLNGVMVTAGPYQASTGENGEYTLYADEGSYDIIFSKLGYITVIIDDTLSVQGEVTLIDVEMWDMNYPPGTVIASVNESDSLCQVTWSLPNGPYEVILDDGESDDFFVYAQGGSWSAVKFTPAGYPATVIGGKFYVGDGSFPGPFLGSDFGVAVFDDDGLDGKPGTMLDSAGVTVNNSGWVSLDWLNAVVEEGSFYLAMYQSGNVPYAAPIGIDYDNPTYFRSYIKFLDNEWNISPVQDFMIRAWIDGPEEKDHSRDVSEYRLVRYSHFDPDDSPETGRVTDLNTTGGFSYQDDAFDALPAGWYAYGVSAMFTSGLDSEYSLSNIVGHLMDCRVTVQASLSSGLVPVDVEVTLQGLDYPYETYFASTDETGTVVFEQLWKGYYNLTIYKIGYEPYRIENSFINSDKEYTVVLSEKKYSPSCLSVDSLTLLATWCEPRITALNEDFEQDIFPPAGWQSITASETGGWRRGHSGSSYNWIIPPWDSYYSYVNDDAAGSDNDGCCDYLVSPPVDLREGEGFTMKFNSYYDGLYGQLAFVEYSADQGASWDVLYQLLPDANWSDLELDLSALSGGNAPATIWLAFHADDAGEYASGWAIDNVVVSVPSVPANYIDFAVFLDGALVGMTTEQTWNFAPLPYGQTYTASVAARYTSGLSEKDHDTFTSVYLFPPQDLAGSVPDDAVILTWNPPGDEVPDNLFGYNIYRNEVLQDYIPHTGSWVPQNYIQESMPPGIYNYTVTGVYDLTPFGFPGETGESMKAGPETVTVDYCSELEFTETWDIGGFEENKWLSDGSNWSVTGMTGNPVPCAEFSREPAQTDYSIALESYPVCAVGITEGTIWLNFDLALYSIQATGQEMLVVQAWNWDTQVWNTVKEFSNIDGNFDWISCRVDIGASVMNSIFKIRFLATGENSMSLRGWFVDNIHIFRDCTAPGELAIDPYSVEGIRLSWLLPGSLNETEGDFQSGSRALVGLYLFRSENGGDYSLIKVLPGGEEYIDPDTNLVFGSDYCYRMNAIWQSPTDYCESTFSNDACMVWTGIEGNIPAPGIDCIIYPNPASNFVTIESSEEIEMITLYRLTGQNVLERAFQGKKVQLATTGISAGTYLMRISTSTGTVIRLVSIHK